MNDKEAMSKYFTDSWVYDKRTVASLYNVLNGVGPLPTNGKYCIKPIRNLEGCSLNSKIVENMEGYQPPPGMAWFEYIEIPHWTADYVRSHNTGEWTVQNLFVGFQLEDHTRFAYWMRVEYCSQAIQNLIAEVPFPKIILDDIYDCNHVNIEWRSNKPIEVHLRGNTDPVEYDCIVPIWDNTPKYAIEAYHSQSDWEYLEDKEEHPGRIGFFVRRWDHGRSF